MLDQALRVSAVDEEARRARLLDRNRGRAARLHREPENPDVVELGANTRRRFDAVHVRHRDVHEDNVGA
jgi:hypothetical protein